MPKNMFENRMGKVDTSRMGRTGTGRWRKQKREKLEGRHTKIKKDWLKKMINKPDKGGQAEQIAKTLEELSPEDRKEVVLEWMNKKNNSAEEKRRSKKKKSKAPEAERLEDSEVVQASEADESTNRESITEAAEVTAQEAPKQKEQQPEEYKTPKSDKNEELMDSDEWLRIKVDKSAETETSQISNETPETLKNTIPETQPKQQEVTTENINEQILEKKNLQGVIDSFNKENGIPVRIDGYETTASVDDIRKYRQDIFTKTFPVIEREGETIVIKDFERDSKKTDDENIDITLGKNDLKRSMEQVLKEVRSEKKKKNKKEKIKNLIDALTFDTVKKETRRLKGAKRKLIKELFENDQEKLEDLIEEIENSRKRMHRLTYIKDKKSLIFREPEDQRRRKKRRR